MGSWPAIQLVRDGSVDRRSLLRAACHATIDGSAFGQDPRAMGCMRARAPGQ